MHKAPMSDQTQTNNICKGWINRFHTLLGQDHSTIWKIIETLQAGCAFITGVLILNDPKEKQERLR